MPIIEMIGDMRLLRTYNAAVSPDTLRTAVVNMLVIVMDYGNEEG
jgi:hypothetical protein